MNDDIYTQSAAAGREATQPHPHFFLFCKRLTVAHMAGQKIGFYSIRKYARLMCRFIFIFTPAIKKAFPDNTTLHEALEVANAACEVLVSEIDLVAEPGV